MCDVTCNRSIVCPSAGSDGSGLLRGARGGPRFQLPLCALSVAPAAATADVSACCSCRPLTEVCASLFSALFRDHVHTLSVKDTQWTTLDNVSNHVIHFFSLPSFHLVPRPLLPSIPLVPVGDGGCDRLPLPLSVLSGKWAAATSPAPKRTSVGKGLAGQGRAGGEKKEERGRPGKGRSREGQKMWTCMTQSVASVYL